MKVSDRKESKGNRLKNKIVFLFTFVSALLLNNTIIVLTK